MLLTIVGCKNMRGERLVAHRSVLIVDPNEVGGLHTWSTTGASVKGQQAGSKRARRSAPPRTSPIASVTRASGDEMSGPSGGSPDSTLARKRLIWLKSGVTGLLVTST